MTLAEKILSLRTQRGMSQDDLAEKLEVSRQSVSKWETAQSTPDLDKIIKLADLFGVSVDELVREGEHPQPSEPPQPQVVYLERRRELTPVQKAGVVLAAAGIVLAIIGFMGMRAVLILLAPALIILSLPLMLAKKHPFLIAGWIVAALSCLVLNPRTSASPWGLFGGLQYMYYLIVYRETDYLTYILTAGVGIIRGLLTLTLLILTGRAWKHRKGRAKL